MTELTYNREEWLTTAGTMIQAMILDKHIDSSMRSTPFYISMGNNRSTKILGECWTRARSDKGINHIFIASRLTDEMQILSILTHELIHAADDCASKHGGFFRKTALALGFTGKMTSTECNQGTKLYEQLATIYAALGTIQHDGLNTEGAKKEGTRQIKAECLPCGFIFRTSRKQLDVFRDQAGNACPCCDSTMVIG